MNQILEEKVAAHYHQTDLLEAIINGLKISGANPDAPSLEDLAPVDEFHTAGRAATIMALDMVPMMSGKHILDAGCGIGGTARYLARKKDAKSPELI